MYIFRFLSRKFLFKVIECGQDIDLTLRNTITKLFQWNLSPQKACFTTNHYEHITRNKFPFSLLQFFTINIFPLI